MAFPPLLLTLWEEEEEEEDALDFRLADFSSSKSGRKKVVV